MLVSYRDMLSACCAKDLEKKRLILADSMITDTRERRNALLDEFAAISDTKGVTQQLSVQCNRLQLDREQTLSLACKFRVQAR